MKKILSVLLSISLLFALSAPAFAVSPVADNATATSEYNSGANTRIEELNDSLLFIYSDDNLVFCSQIDTDGNVIFAYVESTQNQVFESDVMRLDEVIEGIDLNNLSKEVISENITSWSNQMIDRLSEFDVSYSMNCNTALATSDLREQAAPYASTPISTMLNATYGENYTNRLAGYSNKSHNGVNYAVYCRETQSTYQLKYAPYEFAVGKAIVAIVAWIATGGFSFSIQWFLSAAGAVASSAGAAGTLLNAISGDLYVYECDRTRIVTVPAYTSTTQYWAGWTLKSTFLDNGSTWDVSTYHDIKHSDYDDVSGLMQTGFNNFIEYTLQ